MPFVVAALEYVELHEGAGVAVHFPGRRGLAGTQTDDRVAGSQRLARFHGEFLGDAVALVEKADLGDALRHRRAGQALLHMHRALILAALFLRRGRDIPGGFGIAASSERTHHAEREQPPARPGGPSAHHVSGAQAS